MMCRLILISRNSNIISNAADLQEASYDSDFSLFSFNDQEALASVHSIESSGDYTIEPEPEPESFHGKLWTKSDDETLQDAVETLGTSYWPQIAQHWIMGGKDANDCFLRWKHLIEDQSKNTGTVDEKGDNCRTSKGGQQRKSLKVMSALKPSRIRFKHRKPLAARRRKELEALEERRLFGKSTRSRKEREMIHRAYIVGNKKLDQVLKMNDIKELKRNGRDTPHISMTSIKAAMRRVSRSDMDDNAQAVSKSLKKLPKNILSLQDEDIMSPDSIKPKQRSEAINNFLDYDSSALPVAAIIDTVNKQMIEEKRKVKDFGYSSDDDSYAERILQECISPPLKHCFPCLPMPTLPRHLSSPTKPVPILFFRS